MSNKVVPQTYRQIIDKVIGSVRPDFEENGIEENVLVALQQSWEAKLATSRVADFSSDARLGAYQRMLPPVEESASKDTNGASGSNKENGQTNGKENDVKPTLPSASASSSKAPSASNNKALSSAPSSAPTDTNELNSDLDESDSDLLSDDEDPDDEDGAGGGGRDEGDVIIALYEKVQRVKNKWKITLKDGVISAEGKDYLFGKCQGDFEW